jgi:hypothetical protein
MATKEEINRGIKEGKIEVIEEQKNEDASLSPSELQPNPDKLPFKLEDYIAILQVLRAPAKYLESAPTFTPKSFVESIQFYDDGVNFRLYLYINGTWRYVVLT